MATKKGTISNPFHGRRDLWTFSVGYQNVCKKKRKNQESNIKQFFRHPAYMMKYTFFLEHETAPAFHPEKIKIYRLN